MVYLEVGDQKGTWRLWHCVSQISNKVIQAGKLVFSSNLEAVDGRIISSKRRIGIMTIGKLVMHGRSIFYRKILNQSRKA